MKTPEKMQGEKWEWIVKKDYIYIYIYWCRDG